MRIGQTLCDTHRALYNVCVYVEVEHYQAERENIMLESASRYEISKKT